MRKFYHHLSETKRLLFWIVVGGFIAFLISSFCFFIGYHDIPLGIILGTLISVLNLVILEKQCELCVRKEKPKSIATLFYMLRFLLYACGLALALTMEKFVFPLFNVYAVFGAYILPRIIMYIFARKEGQHEKN